MGHGHASPPRCLHVDEPPETLDDAALGLWPPDISRSQHMLEHHHGPIMEQPATLPAPTAGSQQELRAGAASLQALVQVAPALTLAAFPRIVRTAWLIPAHMKVCATSSLLGSRSRRRSIVGRPSRAHKAVLAPCTSRICTPARAGQLQQLRGPEAPPPARSSILGADFRAHACAAYNAERSAPPPAASRRRARRARAIRSAHGTRPISSSPRGFSRRSTPRWRAGGHLARFAARCAACRSCFTGGSSGLSRAISASTPFTCSICSSRLGLLRPRRSAQGGGARLGRVDWKAATISWGSSRMNPR